MDWRTGVLLRHLCQLPTEQSAGYFADHELVERYAARRDEAAFAIIVHRHGPLVWRVCLDVTQHEQDAEDAFQAAFLVLARRASSFRKGASLARWLHGVAYRVALRARAQTVRQPVAKSEVETMFQADPLAEVSRREEAAILHGELSRLAEKYRAPLVLYYLEGKTQDEAARQLTWSKRTLERRLGQARGLLRRRLRRRGLALPAALEAGYVAPALALPVGLVPATVRAAGTFVTRSAAFGGASARAVALAEWLLRASVMGQVKTVAVLTVVCGVLAAGGSVLAHQAWVAWNADVRSAAGPAGKRLMGSPLPAPQSGDRLDAYGDPLPDGVQARLGTTRLSAGNGIFAVAFSPDGQTLASGNDRGARIWRATTGEILFNLEAPPGDCVLPLAFAPDGKTLAGSGISHTIRLWDLRTGTVCRDLQGHEGKVFGLVFSPDGQLLASGSTDRTIRVWRVATGEECGRLTQDATENKWSLTWPVAFLPDGRTLVTRDMNFRLCLWDVVSGKELHRPDVVQKRISAMALAPDGPEGAMVATAGDGRPTIRLWEATSGQELRQLHGHRSHIDALAFSADGTILAAADADGMIRLWQVTTGTELGQIRTDQIGFHGLLFSSDGRWLVSWIDSTIRLWEVKTGEEQLPYQGHRDSILAVAFRPDDQCLATLGIRGTVELWDPGTGRYLGSPAPPQRNGHVVAVFSPDGKRLASATNKGIIRVSDAATGKEILSWQGHKAFVYSLAFTADGQTLASASADKTVALWEPLSGKEVARFADNPDQVQSVAFSPDGQLLAYGGRGGTLQLREVATGTCRHRFPPAPYRVRALAFSPDGKTLASATGPLLPSARGEGTVYLWEVATGQARWQTTLPNGGTNCLAFTPDGRVLALAGGDNRIYRLDLAARRRLPPLTGHLGPIPCLAYSPRGMLLASGSMDTTALIWKQTPLPPLATLRGDVLTPQELEVLWNDLAGADAGRAYRAIWELAGAAEQAVPILAARLQSASVEESPGLPALRAAEVMERIATPEAYRLLETLATGDAEGQVTKEAWASLRRLDKQRAGTP
jgi:RNA polymerase sigma factor (sigma-70 family)